MVGYQFTNVSDDDSTVGSTPSAADTAITSMYAASYISMQH